MIQTRLFFINIYVDIFYDCSLVCLTVVVYAVKPSYTLYFHGSTIFQIFLNSCQQSCQWLEPTTSQDICQWTFHLSQLLLLSYKSALYPGSAL